MRASDFNMKYSFIDRKHVMLFIKGLQEDLEVLRLHTSSDLSFDHFASGWRDLKFASIFGCRYSITEIREFVECVLHYAKGYIFAENLQSSAFGIYLMYAVYYKQPITNLRAKLRLTVAELKNIKSICLKMKGNPIYVDCYAVMSWCFTRNLFQIVAAEFDAGIEYGFRKYFPADLEESDGTNTGSVGRLELSELDEFEKVLNIYDNKKKLVFDNCEAFSSQSDFVTQMKVYLNELEFPSHDDGRVKQVDATDPDAGPSDIGERRAELKRKIFKQEVTTLQALR